MFNQEAIERARQIRLANAQQQAQQEYEAQRAQLDNKYNNGGLGGFLGGIIGGIGKGIGDIGNSVVDMIGSGVASARDLGSILTTGKSAGENEKWLMSRRGTDNAQDAYAKTAGQALNAATTLASTAVPMAGAGGVAAKALGGTVANTAAGAVGGLADELQQQGKDANLESAANRAISGAIAGLTTGGLNKKIGNATGNISSKLLNNKLATSAVGRGALSGAVGGATGAGTSAALGGGDIGQAALQGGLSGAVAGGVQGGLMSTTGKIIRNRVGNNAQATEPVQVEDEFRAYGDSELAKRTKGNQASKALERFGNTLEGAQTNVTRAAARDLGIESTGKVIENVRKKTGLTNLETQATIAKELTGGENSLMDTVQRNALAATEGNANNYLADPTKLLGEIDGIVDKYATTAALGEAGIDKLKDSIRTDILNRKQDLLTKSNNFKASASELRGKGIVNPSEGDSARAKIYSEVAQKLDDLSYSAIPKENINDMFDATITEMRSRATQARNNGNKVIAKAYDQLANALDKEPRTIKAYRSFKKDFVDVSKIGQLTGQAENGAGVQMNTGLLGGVRRFANKMLERPTNAALAKVGGAVNSLAGAVDNLGSGTDAILGQPLSQNTQNVMSNLIGRTAGQQGASNNVQNARKAQEYQTLENMFGGLAGGSQGLTGAQSATNTMGAYPTAQTSQIEAQLADIANGMSLAMAAGDYKAYDQLADLYKTAYDIYKTQANATTKQTKLTTEQQKANAAASNLAQLESMTPDFGYMVRDIPLLNAVNMGGNKYASTADSLASQLGYLLSGATVKDDELQRIKDEYVPQPWDSEDVRQYKLSRARAVIEQYQNNLANS